MSRQIQDQDLRTWEAYATPGAFGYPANAGIMFHCMSDPQLRARVLPQEGDRADAEERVTRASAAELAGMLRAAEEVK